MPRPVILGPDGRPVSSADLKREVATPTLAGVRPVVSGHPAEGLTARRLAAIHRAAAEGDALAYLELAEDIEERDLHYAAVLSTRKRALQQLPVTVAAASDDPEHVRHADFLRDWVATGVLTAAIGDMADAIAKGFAVLEIDWRTDPDKPAVPAALRWKPQRWFTFDPADGETVLLREGVTGQPLPHWKFITHRHPSKSGLTIRSGLARVASWAWMYKSFTGRDWAIYTQNHGQPLRLGRYGTGTTEAERDILWRAVANIAGDCAAIVPESMKIEFVQAGDLSKASDLYERRCDWLDRQTSKLVLGQTTTTDAVSGGHAVAQEHRLVQEDIERADAALITATLRAQLVPLIVSLNFGPQDAWPALTVGRPDQVPLPQVVEALARLGPLGLAVEASEVRDRLGFSDPAPEAELVGGRAAAPLPPAAGSPAPQSRLVLHAAGAAADEQLTGAAARHAGPALDGMVEAVRLALMDAADIPDAIERLQRLKLDQAAFAQRMAEAMALGNLAGQATVASQAAAASRTEIAERADAEGADGA